MTTEEKRPWGLFKTFALNQKCTVKLLEIKPYESLSLQKHKKRDECWYFLDNAIVQIENKKIKVKEGSLINIKKNQEHRIIAEKNKVKVIEVSFGIFDEKDEIRLKDKYGRK